MNPDARPYYPTQPRFNPQGWRGGNQNVRFRDSSGDRSRGRFPYRDTRQDRGRSLSRPPQDQRRNRSNSRNRKRNRGNPGGPYNGQPPIGGSSDQPGVYNPNYPHNHPDSEVINTNPNKWTWPSRSRITKINHQAVGGGITTHTYVITYSTIDNSFVPRKGILKKPQLGGTTGGIAGALGLEKLKI